jgi:hypothetical protein
MNRVPMLTPHAPRHNAAASPKPSANPPDAINGSGCRHFYYLARRFHAELGLSLPIGALISTAHQQDQLSRHCSRAQVYPYRVLFCCASLLRSYWAPLYSVHTSCLGGSGRRIWEKGSITAFCRWRRRTKAGLTGATAAGSGGNACAVTSSVMQTFSPPPGQIYWHI